MGLTAVAAGLGVGVGAGEVVAGAREPRRRWLAGGVVRAKAGKACFTSPSSGPPRSFREALLFERFGAAHTLIVSNAF